MRSATFPSELQKSDVSNFEILGIPIGDLHFHSTCAKCLLLQLEDVGVVNLQAALTLLHLCGCFCKLVHFSRATPILVLFNTGVDVSDSAWQQAQLSLGGGGLALRSLAFHPYAAFIASVCSTGFGPSLVHNLTKAIEILKSSVAPAEVVNTEALSLSPACPPTSWMTICLPCHY